MYLKRVTQRTSFGEYSTNKNDTANGGAYLFRVPEKEIKARMEKMTGGKFDKNGLLKANWVSGEFTLGADAEYVKGFIHAGTFAAKTLYNVVFEKGVLKELIKI